MHEQGIAHRDCAMPNIMMDASALYPDGFHPINTDALPDGFTPAKPLPRHDQDITYYFIDFGLSRRYDPNRGPPRELPIFPADKSVPEHQGAFYDIPSDPFATDIYLLGNAIRDRFTTVRGILSCFIQHTDALSSDVPLRTSISSIHYFST